MALFASAAIATVGALSERQGAYGVGTFPAGPPALDCAAMLSNTTPPRVASRNMVIMRRLASRTRVGDRC